MSLAMDVKFAPLADYNGQPNARHVVVVVGCGGTGARLFMPLMKMLTAEDLVLAVDDDVVEQRNIVRQHFTADDVGKHKAQVMEERYSSSDGTGPQVIALLTRAMEETDLTGPIHEMGLLAAPRRRASVVIFGCVDSAIGRKTMLAAAARLYRDGRAVAYIDSGNEHKTGQALLAFSGNHNLHSQSVLFQMPGMEKVPLRSSLIEAHGYHRFPELFSGEEGEGNADAAENCAARIDLQTFMVNQMAATAALNLSVPFLYPGVSLRNLGAMFTTFNTMTPILPERQDVTIAPAGVAAAVLRPV